MSDEHPPTYFRKKTSSKMFDRIVNTPLVTYAKFHFRWKHHRPGITAQKMKFAIMDFFRKCDQTTVSLQIWSHLLRKSVMENLFVNIIKHKNNFLPQNTHAHKNRQENHKVKRLYLRNIVSHIYIDAVARNNAIFL